MPRDVSQTAASLQIARRFLAREAVPESKADPLKAGAALQRTCSRVFDNLCDALGQDGCTALLARALARTEADHPALKTIRRLDDGSIHLDGVAASVEAHGLDAVTTAIEAFLAALVDVLSRLIGEEMAIRLTYQGALWPRSDDGAQAP